MSLWNVAGASAYRKPLRNIAQSYPVSRTQKYQKHELLEAPASSLLTDLIYWRTSQDQGCLHSLPCEVTENNQV